MSRQIFTARVKGKREKFASTRTSLSESWDQSFCDDGRVPGYPELPSPTIGTKDIAINRLDSQFTLVAQNVQMSPVRLGRGQCGTESGRSSDVEPSPRSSADPVIPASVWRRHVAIQCNIPTSQDQTQTIHVKHGGAVTIRHHPYLIVKSNGRTGGPQTLVQSRRRSKSLDWDQFPLTFHTPLWEPFCDISKPPPELPAVVQSGDYFYYTHPGIAQFIQEDPDEEEDLLEKVKGQVVTCNSCLGFTATSLKEEIDHLTSNLQAGVGSGSDTKKSSPPGELPTADTLLTLQSRPPRPSLTFTLPLEQLPEPKPIKTVRKIEKSVPAYYSASLDQGSTVEKETIPLEGRGKSSTLPTIDNKHIVGIRNAEKRRRFFARKQTNSAPDSFEAGNFFSVSTQGVINTTRRFCGNCKEPVTNCLDGVLRATRRDRTDPIAGTPSVEVWESEIRTARCGNVSVTHVSELDFPDADPPCHFCCEQASTAIHDESRLQIVSGGLVRSRDGSGRSGASPYINLPSPNVQAENGAGAVAFGSIDLSPSMSQTLSPSTHTHQHSHGGYGSHKSIEKISSKICSNPGSRAASIASTTTGAVTMEKEEDPLIGPPVSSLTRRPALVPPKIMSDADYDHEAERDKCSSRNSIDDSSSPRVRRSSVVVIPPMQICPGDLLVYGKVLSQRKSLLGTTIESPSPVQSMFEQDNSSTRKGKDRWSLFKLFERSSRTKGHGTGTLEEVMSIIQPCDFSDPKLSRFKGMCWSDFAAYVLNSKKKNSISSIMSPQDDEVEFLLPRITGSLTDPKLIPAPRPSTTMTLTSPPTIPPPVTTGCESLVVNTSTIASGTVGSDQGSPPSESVLAALAKGPKKPEQSPKPLVRKRMGLMRTMSDRCLERRITPALWRASPGFLLSEKLVEGKESDVGGTKTNGTKSKTGGAKIGGDLVSTVVPVKPELVAAAIPPLDSSTSRPELVDHRQKLRQKEALWDLFQSESSFLYDHLMVLKNVFLEPLKRIQVEGFAMYAEPELLFGNLDELCCVTYGFCKEFIHLLLKLTNSEGELSTTEVLAKLFESSSKARAMSQAYHRYALNYINALNYLETLRRHAEFEEFEKFCMRDPRCKKLQLTDLLVSPVQHIMKVPLILKDIQSRTNEPQEKELIAQILEIQENSIRELDDKMRWLKNFERLLEIQRNIVWPSILEMEPKTWVPEFLRVALARQPCDSLVVSPRRQIIHEGLLQLWDTGKPTETYVILFDDMLLITRRKKGLSKKKSSLTENWASSCKNTGVVGSGLETNHRYIVYRQPISLDRFFIHDIGEAENTTAKLDFAFVLVSLNRFQQIVSVHTLQGTSETVKSTWLLKLKTTQDKWKRTLQNTVFRGVRNSTDSTQSNVASALLGNMQHSKSFLHRET